MRIRKVRTAVSFGFSVIIAILLVQLSVHPLSDPTTGFVKLFDMPGQNVMFSTLESTLGWSFLEPGVRVIMGFAEVTLAILILLPWTRNFAAVSVSALFAAVSALHLSPFLGSKLPLVANQATLGDDGGANFMLHVLVFCLALLVCAISPQNR